MQQEVLVAKPGLHVEFLAINRISDAASNFEIARMPNVLPWLQDTDAQSAWKQWNAAWRDVLILDAENRVIGRDNLSTHDLDNEYFFDALKSAVIRAAKAADTDADGLADAWEFARFASLDPRPLDDPDGDSYDNFSEMAFGSNPADPRSTPLIVASISKLGGQRNLIGTFRRLGGNAVKFAVETSSDLVTWTTNLTAIQRIAPPKNLYDGTGAMEVRVTLSPAAQTREATFLRARPVRPAP